MPKENTKQNHLKSVETRSESTSKQLQQRESQELVIALSGAVGSGVKKAGVLTKERLILEGYKVKEIKVSNLISEVSKSSISNDELNNPKLRYEYLQNSGNKLRADYNSDILAELVISHISILRKEEELESSNKTKESVSSFIPTKTAYLIDQLKHPAEANLLKIVYGNIFYLIPNPQIESYLR